MDGWSNEYHRISVSTGYSRIAYSIFALWNHSAVISSLFGSILLILVRLYRSLQSLSSLSNHSLVQCSSSQFCVASSRITAYSVSFNCHLLVFLQWSLIFFYSIVFRALLPSFSCYAQRSRWLWFKVYPSFGPSSWGSALQDLLRNWSSFSRAPLKAES